MNIAPVVQGSIVAEPADGYQSIKADHDLHEASQLRSGNEERRVHHFHAGPRTDLSQVHSSQSQTESMYASENVTDS